MAEPLYLPVLTTTQSELQKFRDCRRAWHFSYLEGLRPKYARSALTWGTAMHAGLQAAYQLIGTLPADEVVDAARDSARAASRASFAAWVAKVEEHEYDLDVQAFYTETKDMVETAQWAVDHYLLRFGHDFERMVPIAVERPFDVPLRDARGHQLPHVRISGVWDLVWLDVAMGDVVIDDHKSTSSDTSGLDLRAELDPQMEAYLYALQTTLRNRAARLAAFGPAIARQQHSRLAVDALRMLEGAALVTGRVRYNVVRKARPSVPKVNQDGTVSVAAIDTTADVYREALDAQVGRGKPITDKQLDLLERLTWKGWGAYTSRREFHRGPMDVERWRAATVLQAGDMRAAMRDPALRYRNPGHCIHPWSMKCDYRPICIDDAPELRAQYEVRGRHEEVAAARNDSTEGQVG